MSNLADVDCLILGGGCAGLSLAMRLAQQAQRCPSTLILERRTHFENDRTWCFWGTPGAQLQHLVQHQWNTVQLSKDGVTLPLACAETPYSMLAAEHFYHAALTTLEGKPSIRLATGVTVDAAPRWQHGRWHVPTSAGLLSARILIDTRPPAQPDTILWQSFYGQEIECEQAVFQPQIVDLMAFAPACTEQVGFTYVLPLSPTRALIEYTVFSRLAHSATALAAGLDAALSERVNGARFQVLRHEQGILPMGLTAAQAVRPRYIQAGLYGGGCRPATGFAFQRIQRWASACAEAILAGRMALDHRPDPFLLRQMDRLFLQVIRHAPERGPELFSALFKSVKAEHVIRFLSDEGRLGDYLAIVRALPAAPFLRQLLHPVQTQPKPSQRVQK